jgi:N-acyl-D-amino-acid deacylase
MKVGNYADVVVFDAEKVKDNAVFEKPHQYAGVIHVFVNGAAVFMNSEPRSTPGRFVKGPGIRSIGNRQLANVAHV